MNKVKMILAFAALMLCGGAWADAMPVAVWAGNFETKTQGAFTLDLNGNSESTDHSKITINQNVGVKVDTTTAVSGITVLFRVENLEVGESVKTLATASTASNAGNDRIGIYLDANGQTHGIWNNTGTYDTSATAQSSLASIENTAYMALAYSTGGTSFYINTGSGYKAAHVNGTQMASGDTSLYGVCVGGTRSHGTNFAAASGMVITGIAVFNEKFGNTIALSNYQFPDEAQVWLHSKFGSQTNAANEMDSSAKLVFPGIKTLEALQDNYVLSGTINGDWMKDGNYSYTVYPVKIAEEKDGDTLTSLTMQFHGVNDGNMKVATVKFTCSEDGISAQQTDQRYLTPGSNNAATYLFKKQITGGTSVGKGDYTIYSLAAYPKSQLTLPAATAKVISWNVAQDTTIVSGKGEQKTLVGNIPDTAWTEKAGVNEYVSTDYTDVKVYDVASGETTTDNSIKFRWNVTGAANYGYLQAGSNANDAAIESDYEYMGMWLAKLDKSESATSFSVSGIPFMSYDVVLYYNGNAGFDSYQIRPMTINGSKYNVNRMGELVAVGSAVDKKALWGQRGLARPELGVNAGIIKNLSAGSLTITDNAMGGGLAAIQIVEHPVRTTNVTISGDDNLVSTLASQHSFGKDPVIITAEGSATLTVDQAWTYGPLILSSESGTFTIKGADNLELDDLDFSRVAESVVFGFDATTTEYTATEKIKAYMATMSDEKVTFLFKGSATTGATVAYTDTNPIITGHLVFQGGTHHIFKYNGENHVFATGASNEHPTILVESDTTLTVYGHDMTGYSATPTADGIIRVKDRGTLVFENSMESGNTFFYNQRICLDPGAEWTIGESLTGADFRMTGGSSIDQIYVPESATDVTSNPARVTVSSGAHINLAKDGSSQGIGINVGANTKLVFSGDVQSLNSNADVATDAATLAARVIEKKGTGILEITGGNISATIKPSAGTVKYVGVSPASTSFGDGTLELAQNENGDAYTFIGTVSSSALGKGTIKTVAGSTVSLCGTFTDYSGDINSTAANSKFVIPVGQEVTVGLIASNSKIEIEGTLSNTNKTTGTGQNDYTNYQPSNLSGLTGNGTFKIIGPHYFFTSGTSNFSDYWASTLAICNERGENEPGDKRGIVWGQPPNGNKTISIGTLSGFGMMRTDANDGNRSIKVTQSADSEWSGVFYGTNDRLGTFIVAGAEGATAKTLTLSGTQTHTNDLTIEESGSVKITGTWKATTVIVNGRLEVLNTATLEKTNLTCGYQVETADSVIYYGSEDMAEGDAVALVGDNYYWKLSAALEAASTSADKTVVLKRPVAIAVEIPEGVVVEADFENRITGVISGSGTYKMLNPNEEGVWDKTIGSWFGSGALTDFNGTLCLARGRFKTNATIEEGRVTLKVTDGAQLYLTGGTISNAIEVSGGGIDFEEEYGISGAALRLDGATCSGVVTSTVVDDVIPSIGVYNATAATISGTVIAPDGIKVYAEQSSGVLSVTGAIKGSATDNTVNCKVEKTGDGEVKIKNIARASVKITTGKLRLNEAHVGANVDFEIASGAHLLCYGWPTFDDAWSIKTDSDLTDVMQNVTGSPNVCIRTGAFKKLGSGNVTMPVFIGNGDGAYTGTIAIAEGSVKFPDTPIFGTSEETQVLSGVENKIVKKTTDGSAVTYALVDAAAKIVTGETTTYYETVQKAIDAVGEEGNITTIQIIGNPMIPDGYCVVDNHLAIAVAQVGEELFASVRAAIDYVGEGDITTIQIIGSPTIPSDYCVVEGHLAYAAAKVGEVGYATLQAAINSCPANGTVTLLASLYIYNTVTVPSSFNGHLDFYGNQLLGKTGATYVLDIENGAVVYLENSHETYPAAIQTEMPYAIRNKGAMVNLSLDYILGKISVVGGATGCVAQFDNGMAWNPNYPFEIELNITSTDLTTKTPYVNIPTAQSAAFNVNTLKVNRYADGSYRLVEVVSAEAGDYTQYKIGAFDLVAPVAIGADNATLTDKTNLIAVPAIAMCAKVDTPITFKVAPNTGYVVQDVMYQFEDGSVVEANYVNATVTDGVYTIPAPTDSTTLNIRIRTEESGDGFKTANTGDEGVWTIPAAANTDSKTSASTKTRTMVNDPITYTIAQTYTGSTKKFVVTALVDLKPVAQNAMIISVNYNTEGHSANLVYKSDKTLGISYNGVTDLTTSSKTFEGLHLVKFVCTPTKSIAYVDGEEVTVNNKTWCIHFAKNGVIAFGQHCKDPKTYALTGSVFHSCDVTVLDKDDEVDKTAGLPENYTTDKAAYSGLTEVEKAQLTAAFLDEAGNVSIPGAYSVDGGAVITNPTEIRELAAMLGPNEGTTKVDLSLPIVAPAQTTDANTFEIKINLSQALPGGKLVLCTSTSADGEPTEIDGSAIEKPNAGAHTFSLDSLTDAMGEGNVLFIKVKALPLSE